MQILRADQHKRMPWKNGGGETTEIAVFPENAGLNDFDWRVSMARVDGDGPFSGFPGIGRTLAILEGAGIVLKVDGQAATRLTRETPPHSFPADVPTAATLITGAVTDFNVMSRRGKVDHTVERLHGKRALSAGFERLILCASGEIAINMAEASGRLGCYDAALLGQDEAAALAPTPGSEFYLVEFRPA